MGADENSSAFSARVTFDASGKLTQVLVNGSDENLTATTTRVSDGLYQMTFAEGGRGYLLVDSDGSHSFLIHQSNWKLALQKGATGTATTSGTEVVRQWTGHGVVIDDTFRALLADFTANMDVDASRSFDAVMSTGVNVAGSLSTHAGSGLWSGTYTDNRGPGFMWVFMTPDEEFAGSLACTQGRTFPEWCSVAIWAPEGGNGGTATLWYKDADGDGYSDGTTVSQVGQPAGYQLGTNLVATSGDCDDAAAAVHPGATEVCGDHVDNDCSGGDATCPAGTTWYKDADGDGYSDGSSVTQVGQPAGYQLAANLFDTAGDCNDSDAEVNPGAVEICGDGVDNDCYLGDVACLPNTTWYKDADGDGYSDGTTVTQSEHPAGYQFSGGLTSLSGDCDDGNADIHPGAAEIVGDGIDQNCDGSDAAASADITGVWEITDTVLSGGCIDGTVQTYLITIAWDGTRLANTKGAFSIFGDLTGDTADFSGSSYDNPETGYTLTFSSYLLTLSLDGSQVTGSAAWESAPTAGGGTPCAGVSQLSGVRAQAPAAPTNLAAQASGTSVSLAWTDQSATEEAFVIERSGPDVLDAFAEIATLTANAQSYTDSGLAANAVYAYRVRAHSAAGYSDYTSVVDVTTSGAGPSPDDPVAWARANAVGGWTTVATTCSPLPDAYILAHFFMCPAGGLRGYEDWSWTSWDYVARGNWWVTPSTTSGFENYATIRWNYTTSVNVGGVLDTGPGTLAQGDADMIYRASTDEILYWEAGCWFIAQRLTNGSNQDIDDSYCDSSYSSSGDQCGTDADCGRCWYCDTSGSNNVCRYGGEGPYGCYRGWEPPVQ